MMTVTPHTEYRVECWRDGHLVWTEDFHNLVVTVGKNKLLDAGFKTGLASPLWYLGLVDDASFSAYDVTDTMGSHAGWIEATAYDEVARQQFVPSTPAAGATSNSANKATYTMNATKTIRGAFMANDSTKGGGSGILYGVGNFAASQGVISGDILVVTTTLSLT